MNYRIKLIRRLLKNAPGGGTGPTGHVGFRRNLVGRVPPRGILRVFQHPVRILAILFPSCLSLCSARADVTLSTFENFNLDTLYSSWLSGTVVSGATNYSITATGFGSGYKALSPNVDATGEIDLELTVMLSGTGGPSAPISGPIVSLVDADGTFCNYAWYGQVAGTHVLRARLNAPTFTSAPGSVPGLDLANLAFYHLQDDPGAYTGQYTITFLLLRLTGAAGPQVVSEAYDNTSQQFTLTWASRANMNYTVMYAPDLATGFSALVTDIPSTGSSTTTTVTIPGGQSGFLRIAQQ